MGRFPSFSSPSRWESEWSSQQHQCCCNQSSDTAHHEDSSTLLCPDFTVDTNTTLWLASFLLRKWTNAYKQDNLDLDKGVSAPRMQRECFSKYRFDSKTSISNGHKAPGDTGSSTFPMTDMNHCPEKCQSNGYRNRMTNDNTITKSSIVDELMIVPEGVLCFSNQFICPESLNIFVLPFIIDKSTSSSSSSSSRPQRQSHPLSSIPHTSLSKSSSSSSSNQSVNSQPQQHHKNEIKKTKNSSSSFVFHPFQPSQNTPCQIPHCNSTNSATSIPQTLQRNGRSSRISTNTASSPSGRGKKSCPVSASCLLSPESDSLPGYPVHQTNSRTVNKQHEQQQQEQQNIPLLITSRQYPDFCPPLKHKFNNFKTNCSLPTSCSRATVTRPFPPSVIDLTPTECPLSSSYSSALPSSLSSSPKTTSTIAKSSHPISVESDLINVFKTPLASKVSKANCKPVSTPSKTSSYKDGANPSSSDVKKGTAPSLKKCTSPRRSPGNGNCRVPKKKNEVLEKSPKGSQSSSSGPVRGREVDGKAQERRNRRAHPYSRPADDDGDSRKRKKTQDPASFDLAYRDLRELMECMTSCCFPGIKKKKPRSRRGRFFNYKFVRSKVIQIDKEVEQPHIPDAGEMEGFEERAKMADMMDELIEKYKTTPDEEHDLNTSSQYYQEMMAGPDNDEDNDVCVDKNDTPSNAVDVKEETSKVPELAVTQTPADHSTDYRDDKIEHSSSEAEKKRPSLSQEPADGMESGVESDERFIILSTTGYESLVSNGDGSVLEERAGDIDRNRNLDSLKVPGDSVGDVGQSILEGEGEGIDPGSEDSKSPNKTIVICESEDESVIEVKKCESTLTDVLEKCSQSDKENYSGLNVTDHVCRISQRLKLTQTIVISDDEPVLEEKRKSERKETTLLQDLSCFDEQNELKFEKKDLVLKANSNLRFLQTKDPSVKNAEKVFALSEEEFVFDSDDVIEMIDRTLIELSDEEESKSDEKGNDGQFSVMTESVADFPENTEKPSVCMKEKVEDIVTQHQNENTDCSVLNKTDRIVPGDSNDLGKESMEKIPGKIEIQKRLGMMTNVGGVEENFEHDIRVVVFEKDQPDTEDGLKNEGAQGSNKELMDKAVSCLMENDSELVNVSGLDKWMKEIDSPEAEQASSLSYTEELGIVTADMESELLEENVQLGEGEEKQIGDDLCLLNKGDQYDELCSKSEEDQLLKSSGEEKEYLVDLSGTGHYDNIFEMLEDLRHFGNEGGKVDDKEERILLQENENKDVNKELNKGDDVSSSTNQKSYLEEDKAITGLFTVVKGKDISQTKEDDDLLALNDKDDLVSVASDFDYLLEMNEDESRKRQECCYSLGAIQDSQIQVTRERSLSGESKVFDTQSNEAIFVDSNRQCHVNFSDIDCLIKSNVLYEIGCEIKPSSSSSSLISSNIPESSEINPKSTSCKGAKLNIGTDQDYVDFNDICDLVGQNKEELDTGICPSHSVCTEAKPNMSSKNKKNIILNDRSREIHNEKNRGRNGGGSLDLNQADKYGHGRVCDEENCQISNKKKKITPSCLDSKTRLRSNGDKSINVIPLSLPYSKSLNENNSYITNSKDNNESIGGNEVKQCQNLSKVKDDQYFKIVKSSPSRSYPFAFSQFSDPSNVVNGECCQEEIGGGVSGLEDEGGCSLPKKQKSS